MPIYTLECKCCGEVHDEYLQLYDSPNPACHCGGDTERVWSIGLNVPASSYPYVTRHIDPKGRPIEVKSALHERELCRRYGVVKRDDAGFLTQEYHGYDRKTGKQRYKESSGQGMKGCWV